MRNKRGDRRKPNIYGKFVCDTVLNDYSTPKILADQLHFRKYLALRIQWERRGGGKKEAPLRDAKCDTSSVTIRFACPAHADSTAGHCGPNCCLPGGPLMQALTFCCRPKVNVSFALLKLQALNSSGTHRRKALMPLIVIFHVSASSPMSSSVMSHIVPVKIEFTDKIHISQPITFKFLVPIFFVRYKKRIQITFCALFTYIVPWYSLLIQNLVNSSTNSSI